MGGTGFVSSKYQEHIKPTLLPKYILVMTVPYYRHSYPIASVTDNVNLCNLCTLLLLAVQDLADQKARIQKSTTDSGGGVREQRRIDKPEDLLKLIMTADELHSQPQNRTKLPLQAKQPGEV